MPRRYAKGGVIPGTIECTLEKGELIMPLPKIDEAKSKMDKAIESTYNAGYHDGYMRGYAACKSELLDRVLCMLSGGEFETRKRDAVMGSLKPLEDYMNKVRGKDIKE